jgi:hypothetical protein
MGRRNGTEICALATGHAQRDGLDGAPYALRSGTITVAIVHQVQVQMRRMGQSASKPAPPTDVDLGHLASQVSEGEHGGALLDG